MNRYLKNRAAAEADEDRCLNPYGVKSSQSRGRVHKEPGHPLRTAFQRDRDRVIHSAAFRRLEAKTQVFLDHQSDYYRTRLTHTIEVAQVARTMARILGVNEDLAEAASLAHDLGHPPYGHSGEAVINELMQDYGGFEHNRHSMRIVEYLEHPYPSFRGLNLTYETRECLARHETKYDVPGVYEEFGDGWASLEGQIADVADAIAYNSHDLDDALACGMLAEEDLREIRLYQRVRESIEAQFPAAHRYARQLRSAKALIETLTVNVVEETNRRLTACRPASVDQVRACGVKLVGYSADFEPEVEELQVFLRERVYEHPQVMAAVEKAGGEICYLFELYCRDAGKLPRRYQDRIEEQGLQRVVCDYIAGMTDRFCRAQYEKYH